MLDLSSWHGWLRTGHISAAFLGLAVFWLPLLVQKGGRLHVVCGRVFVACATVALVTALVICGRRLIDPMGSFGPDVQPPAEQAADFIRLVRLIFAFLGALAVYTLVPLVLAVRVVRTRRDPDRLAGSGIRLLLWLEIGVSVLLMLYASAHWIRDPNMLFCAVPLGAGIGGLASAWWDRRFLVQPRASPMAWWYKHMELMLRTGIAFHTAFAVFVLSPWLGSLVDGGWALVPWVVPSVVGIPAVWLWIRHYRRKFEELAPVALPMAGIAPHERVS